MAPERVELPKGRPSPGLVREREALERFAADAYVGRSFGARVCARLPVQVPRVFLGYPIRPPGRPRPEDEEALLNLRSPTLIVQGSDDELGPLDVLKGLQKRNKNLEVQEIHGAGHSFGRHEKAALECAAKWLQEHARR